MNEERPSLPRIVDTSGPAGQLLRQVLAEQELDQALPRFIDLRQRRARRVRRQRVAGAMALALALALLAVGAVDSGGGETPAIRAERVAHRTDRDVSPAAEPIAERPPSTAPAPTVRASGASSSGQPKLRASNAATRTGLDKQASPARTGLGKPEGAAPPATHADDTAALGGAKTCAGLARTGAAEEAITCYEKLAGGRGISAELALFEQARLAGKVLNRPDRALLTLQSYRERFPQGALRAEVMLAQIDWLLTSGQSAQALALIDEALRSGLVRERAAELEQVRARLQREPAPQP